MEINDNVYKNLEKFSILPFDQAKKYKKDEYKASDKILIVDKLIENADRKKQETLLFEATDRILYAHRNLKLLITVTSGPFFVLLFGFKYAFKLGILYFLYSKTK